MLDCDSDSLSLPRLIVGFENRFPYPLNVVVVPLVLGGPFLAAYVALHFTVGAPDIRYSLLLAIAWFAFSPVLIAKGDRTIEWFLSFVRPVIGAEDHEELQRFAAREFYSNYCIPFSLTVGTAMAAGGALLGHNYQHPVSVVAYLTILGFVAGFTAGIGFRGIVFMNSLLRRFCGYRFFLDPFNADGYGGLYYVSRFLVLGIVLFYSGSLYIPIAVELLRTTEGYLAAALPYALVLGFVGFGLFNFGRSVVIFHDKMLAEKVRIDDESQERLSSLVERHLLTDRENGSMGDALKPLVYYLVHHRRITSMREYPYDFRTMMQIGGSTLIPIVVFLADFYLHG